MKINIYKIIYENLKGKKTIERSRLRLKDNIEISCNKICCKDEACFDLAQDVVRWLVFVNV